MSQPNVLLVVLDSVRAQNVGHLGYQRDTTPRLDTLADRATTYSNAKAPGIHSIASHVSLFTGYHVAEHRATSHGTNLAPGHTVWEELAADGYRTGLFTPNAIVAESSNLASFFDVVSGPKRDVLVFPDALGPESVSGNPSYTEYIRACLESGSPAKAVVNGLAREFGNSSAAHDPEREHGGEYVREFLEWRESNDGPWAACLNLMDAHYPYLPQEEYDQWGGDVLQDLHREAMGGPLTTQYLGERPFWELEASASLYDGCIRQADAYLAELLDRLEAANELEDTLVVVTSDHGEGFGEYSVVNDAVRLIDHSWGIGDELAHVPLVVKFPGQTAGETVTEPASLTQFPSVVRTVLNGERGSFVPDDGYTITSSYRLEEPATELPLPESEREPYFGPWHAVCHKQGNRTVVDAIRREDQVRFESSIHDQRAARAPPDREFVESAVETLERVDVTEADGDIDAEVEQRLHELGYKA